MQRSVVGDPKFSNWQKEFEIFCDDSGILRCKGRLQKATLTFEQKDFVILHTTHRYTDLIVICGHRRVAHNGVKETLTELRSAYWVVRGCHYIRSLLVACRVCKRLESVAYTPPKAPRLPEFRTTIDAPFTYTGVDFAGLLYIKEQSAVKKVHISLFTCGVTRTIHLDLVPDLSADTFLGCFHRFTARFSIPKEMKSDIAKTFTANTLCALFELDGLSSQLDSRAVKWSINLEKAPWWGGFFERLVKSIKRCLKKILQPATVTYEELLTMLIEIEAVLNSRPLSFVSTEELDEPLYAVTSDVRSAHTVHAHGGPGRYRGDNSTADSLLKRLVYVKSLIDHFWSL